MSNSFGRHFRIQSFGESHGAGLGVVIDGCPAGVFFQESLLRSDLERRRPGASTLRGNSVVSARQEGDEPEILSGVFEGRTLGTPIAVLVRNVDARSQDYQKISASPRAGHADDVWKEKFGHSDPRGGGRSSGRETLARVVGGSFAKMFLSQVHPGLTITGFSRRIGPFETGDDEIQKFFTQVKPQERSTRIDSQGARFLGEAHEKVIDFLRDAQANGDSAGGTVELHASGMPKSLGQPVFHKLKSDLASAMLSLGATAAFELGAGVAAAESKGQEFHAQSNSKRYGGIRGGISTGEDLIFRVHFKPTSSILDVAKQGRHDPCIVPRAVPVVEAMTALVLADHVLWDRLSRV